MNNRPIALTIAGSDSGGGAGIQADLKVFHSMKVHGVTAITCLTAQNPITVKSVQSTEPAMLKAQLEAVFDELRPDSIKSGMLLSDQLIHVIADFMENLQGQIPLWTLDPVLVSTSGARLLEESAEKAMVERLFPMAQLITPNLDEALELLHRKLDADHDSLEALTQEFYERFQRPVLLKGGHWNLKNDSGDRVARDCFYDGKRLEIFESPWIPDVSTHGSGCSYSAAIAARQALGDSFSEAVRNAKSHINRMIQNSYQIRNHSALNP